MAGRVACLVRASESSGTGANSCGTRRALELEESAVNPPLVVLGIFRFVAQVHCPTRLSQLVAVTSHSLSQ
jgi:hypothetical protein